MFAGNPSVSMGASVTPPSVEDSPGATVDMLKLEDVRAPSAGTRKAKVLYDYDAADTSELSLLADEVRAQGGRCVRLPASARAWL